MEEREWMDKQLRDLIEIIHFTENVAAKVHGLLDEATIYRTVEEEFAKSKRYGATIFLLTDNGKKIEVFKTSLPPGKLKAAEKASGLRLKGHKIDVNKSSIFSQVIREGKTVQVKISDVMGEFVPRPLTHLITKIIGYENRFTILTQLKRHGKITGVLAVSSTELVEHFISSVRNLARHISTALELAEEHAVRKRTEEELLKSQEHKRFLANVLESSSQPFAVGYPDGRLMTFNTAYCKLLGYSEEELRKVNWFTDLTPPEWREIVAKAAEEIRRTGQPQRFEEEYIRKDGSRVPVEVFAHPIFDSKGNLQYYYSFFTDVTELKRMEEDIRKYTERLEELVQKRTEELLESEKKYSVLVEEASDGVIILQDGKIVFSNRKTAEIIGYSRDEIIGLPFEKLVEERYMRRMRGEKVPPTSEIEVIAKTGERIPIEISTTLIHYHGRPADLVIVRDIRERKRMEEERLKLERLAAIGEAAAMVGHDLRNPLQALVNTVYLAKKKLKSMPSAERLGLKELWGTVGEQAEYMNKVVSDLQDYAKPLKPKLVETGLHQLINDTLSTVTVPETVQVSILIEEDFPKLMVDPTLMKRVFTNLVTNALQAMPDGGRLRIIASKNEEAAFISVEDTGVGIPKENLSKLFKTLFTTKARGTGFGLPACKRLVEALHGSITVESEVGRGTTFTVKIPLRREVS